MEIKWKFPFNLQRLLVRFLLLFRCRCQSLLAQDFPKDLKQLFRPGPLCVCVRTAGRTPLAPATKFRLLFAKDFENFGHVRDVQKRLKAYNCRLSSTSGGMEFCSVFRRWVGGLFVGSYCEVFRAGAWQAAHAPEQRRPWMGAVGHDLGKVLRGLHFTPCRAGPRHATPLVPAAAPERANLISVTEISFALKCTGSRLKARLRAWPVFLGIFPRFPPASRRSRNGDGIPLGRSPARLDFY